MDKTRDRIELLISTKGITNNEFAEKIGVNSANISHLLNGRNRTSLDIIKRILKSYKEINAEWLMFGEGPMTKHTSSNTRQSAPTLFDEELEEKSTIEINETQNKSVETLPRVNEEKILQPKEVETPEKERVEVDKMFDRQDVGENKRHRKLDPEFESKKNPYNQQHNSIERIVVFYKDRTFREYQPES